MNTTTAFMLSLIGAVVAIIALYYATYSARRKNRFSPFTEKLLRSPGYTLGEQLDETRADIFEQFTRIILVPIFALVAYTNISGLTFYILLAMAVIFGTWCVVRLVTLFKRVQLLRLGLDGEVYTGQELNFLMRKGAWVFHDIPYQYGNIDHIVVSRGGVFAVETKAVRKPANGEGKRQSTVFVKNGKLNFPHVETEIAINQVKRHAEHIRNFLAKKTGKSYPVTPVVALPGWFVKSEKSTDFLVINPKRGGALKSFVERNVIPENEAEIIANHIEEFARTIQSKSDINDPDARKNYDIFLNRKPETKKL